MICSPLVKRNYVHKFHMFGSFYIVTGGLQRSWYDFYQNNNLYSKCIKKYVSM